MADYESQIALVEETFKALLPGLDFTDFYDEVANHLLDTGELREIEEPDTDWTDEESYHLEYNLWKRMSKSPDYH